LLWLRYFLAVLVLGNFVLIFVVARDSGGGTQVPSDPGPALDGGGPGGPPLLANLPGLGPPAAPGLPVAGLPRIGPPMPTAPIDSPLATPGPAIRLARRSPSFPGSEFMDVALSPPYAYLTGGLVGLAVYRIETPARPQGDVRFTPLPKSLLGGRGYRIVVVRPGLIAISNTLEGVVLVDVRDPESPRLLSQIRSPEGAFEGMAVHGD